MENYIGSHDAMNINSQPAVIGNLVYVNEKIYLYDGSSWLAVEDYMNKDINKDHVKYPDLYEKTEDGSFVQII